jgi:hypothetical protein
VTGASAPRTAIAPRSCGVRSSSGTRRSVCPPGVVRLPGRTTATDHPTFTRDGDHTQLHDRAIFDFPIPVDMIAPMLARPPLEKLADETAEEIRETLER